MLDTPIVKRQKNYPKDFTPPPGYLTNTSVTPSVPSSQVGHITRISHISHIQLQKLNKSTQLTDNTIKESEETTKNIIITINPQDARNNYRIDDYEKQKPLTNGHLNKRMPYISPQLLNRPRMQDNLDKELNAFDDSQVQYSTPGSIKKNVGLQKPLQEEQPSYINVPSKQVFSTKKMQTNDNIFYQSVKSQYSNFNNIKHKKLQPFLKEFQSHPQTSFKLNKKVDMHNSQSYLQTTKQKKKSAQKEKKKLIQFSSLIEQKQIDKLKNHINNIAFSKSRSKFKNKMNATQMETQGQRFQGRKQEENRRAKKRPYSQFQNFNSSRVENYGEYFDSSRVNNRVYAREEERFRAASNPKNGLSMKAITISYKKTSLSQLQSIYKKIAQSPNNVDLQIQVPTLLLSLSDYLPRNLPKQELHQAATNLFQSLSLPSSNITIKRYSNCILMLEKNICILYHYEGKIYIGGWVIKYLDQGCKMGLGLQWAPGRYTYYGEFYDNKKQGLGVMKDKGQAYIGQFQKGQKTGNGFVIRNGVVRQADNRQYQREGQINSEVDPFL